MLTIQEEKKIQIEILKDIDLFCKNNDLKYTLLGGSLLGAVRHKGYIPWDDDIDIGMVREDYEKFIHSYLSSSFAIIRPGDIDYFYPFTKVYAKDTILIEKDSKKTGKFGVYVDVFPIDYVPNDEKKRNKYFKKINRYKNIVAIKNTRLKKERLFLKNMFLCILKICFCSVKIEKLVLKMDKYAKSVKESDYMANSIWGYGYRETTNSTVFCKYILSDFENQKFSIVEKSDEWLTNVFGDYMKLPPIEKRISNHSFDAFYK